MGGIFNPDNKFFTFMGRVADMMLLNLLCILCCIPIVTAGPSITALYYMTMKIERGDDSYIARGFFHSFRQNLKQGIIIHIIMLLVGVILAFDLYFSRIMQATSNMYKVLTYLFMVGIVVYLMILTFIYPVLARFFNTVKGTFRNALLMSIRHFPYTLLIFAISAVPLGLMFGVTALFPYLMMFYILFGFAVISLAQSHFFNKIFNKYIPEETEEEKEETPAEHVIDSSIFTNLHPTNEPDESGSEETDDPQE